MSTTAGRHTPFMIAIVLVVYWYLLRWPVNRFYCRRKFRLHTSADDDIEITVDEKGFRGGTESSRGEFTWGAVSRIVEVTASDGGLAVGPIAIVDFQGSRMEVGLAMTPDAGPGDWVLVDDGLAIDTVDEAEAMRTWKCLPAIADSPDAPVDPAPDDGGQLLA